MTADAPLLSVCIPTFNQAELLELCLATVLPQVAAFPDEVECVISDNASTDRTFAILMESAETFPLRIFRNDENIGIIANITKCAAELARGEFILVIGDDDVLCIGAIDRILKLLRTPDPPDLIALNVGFLPRSERPVASAAFGGVPATTEKTLRRSATSGVVRFEELFVGPCADFTASYSVVLRRRLWLKYFPQACRDEPFTSVRTTYPHAFVIANTMPGRPAGVIATPVVMVYEMPGNEFSWARYRALNSLIHLTSLLKMYQANGVPSQVLKPYFIYQLDNRGSELGDLLWNRRSVGGLNRALELACMLRRYPIRLLRMFLVALNHPDAPRWLAAVPRFLLQLKHFVLGAANKRR